MGSMKACHLCLAAVPVDEDLRNEHYAFHILNKLHGPGCKKALTAYSQQFTGAYLTPRDCTCGLELMTSRWLSCCGAMDYHYEDCQTYLFRYKREGEQTHAQRNNRERQGPTGS